MRTGENNPCVIFGEFIKKTRLASGITARSAATRSGILASNFSKIEHGALKPPQDPGKQKALALAVGIEVGSPPEAKFFDLAANATNSVPVDLAEIISRVEAMPMLLRTIGNKRLTPEEVESIIKIVRGQNGGTIEEQE